MLTQERRGQIALALLKEFITRKGAPTLEPNEVRRNLEDLAKKTGIPFKELVEFFRTLYQELLDEALGG